MGLCPTKNISSILPLFLGVIIILITGKVTGQGMKCSGYCTKDISKCQLRGGKVIGYCTKTLMCCDPLVSATASCGDKKSGQKVVFFKSPSYPGFAGGDLICELKVRIRNDTVAVRIDFVKAEMDGFSFDGGGEHGANCESDMIFIKGFQTWSPPPRCGNLTGYGVLIDLDTQQTRNLGILSILALMSSPKYRFNLRVTQTTKNRGVIWDVKDSFSEKRSVNAQVRSTRSPDPTKLLIKTERPIMPQAEGSFNAETFQLFNSKQPKWKSPSIVNGEDALISTVPWQVSIRTKPQPDPFLDLWDGTTENGATEDGFSITTEDNIMMENSTDVELENDCSESEGTHFCGGTIIHDGRYIISAGHCFYGNNKLQGMINISDIMVVVGDTNKCLDDDETSIFDGEGSGLKSYRYGVESIIFHYGYDHNLLINDVAILRLNESIKYYDHIRPIALANPGDTFEGQQGVVSGWGDRFAEGNMNNYSIEEPQGPNILQSTKLLEIQNQSFCNERELSQLAGPREAVISHAKYKYVFDSTVCTLTQNGSKLEVNTGRGDSGGPLVVYLNETKPVLVGVVSYSIPSDEMTLALDGVNRSLDFFASVAFYRGWIDLVVKSFEQNEKIT
ncbi:unnamed protein product [Orchesella dallaii]|uniref:Peptidase S1 domain-containing protein n=1 Tax=Orchesella dallaii TaxID=48710 RepID=A0ABP1Q869_9HEXA